MNFTLSVSFEKNCWLVVRHLLRLLVGSILYSLCFRCLSLFCLYAEYISQNALQCIRMMGTKNYAAFYYSQRWRTANGEACRNKNKHPQTRM